MITSDILFEINDLYGITISPSILSKITDKVLASAAECQNRALDKISDLRIVNNHIIGNIYFNKKIILKNIETTFF